MKQLEADVNSALEGSGVKVAFSGAVITAIQPNDSLSTIIGLIAAVIVLIIVFGTFVAAGVPLLIALLSLGLGLSLLTLAASVTHFNTITPILATMIGLGVGIDYSLFIVTRFRQALHDGATPEDAAALAGATAGRAVIFAGATVAISICSLAVIGLDFVTKLGFGGAIAVLTTVCTAVTLLPAILRLLGHKIDRWKVPGIKMRNESEQGREQTAMARWGRYVTSHAKAMTGLALVILALMIAPVFSVHLGSSDAGAGPKDSTARQAYDLLAKGFGAGFNGPLLVAIDNTAIRRSTPSSPTRSPRRPASRPSARRSPTRPATRPASWCSRAPRRSPRRRPTSSTRCATRSCPTARRHRREGLHRRPDRRVRRHRRAHLLKLPLFLLVVLGITILLLAMAFRSIVIAVKAAIATLLSSLAAFGVLVLVFQHGVGLPLIGLDQTGTDRVVPAGDRVRDPVRPEHGLRGVPGQPDPRGVHPRRHAPRRDPARHHRHRPGRRGGRDDHGEPCSSPS